MILLIISIITLFSSVIYIIEDSYQKQNRLTKDIIVTKAKSLFEAIRFTRLWNAKLGGVYARESLHLKPNPYLKDNKIKSENNETLIYINPAYMTRQISNLANESKDFSYKVTSLKLINPNNKPNKFEVRALKFFEKNSNEKYYYEFENDKLKFMGGLIVDKSCLKCHINQNYKVGEIKGGISVNVNINDEIVKMENIRKNTNLVYFIITLILVIFLIVLYIFFEKIGRDKKQIITMLKKEKSTQQEMLIQQSKMASMGEMMEIIAHQWRQPLNTIKIINAEIKDSHDFGDLTKEYLDNLLDKSKNQIEFMNKTIDDFREFFSPSKTKEKFSIKEAVLGILNILNPQFNKYNIEIKIHQNSQIDTIYGYENEFKQVILNILNNAKEAILQNSKSGIIEIFIEKDIDRLLVKVIDSGGGIREDVIKNLFKPYITTKESGTGIGLYMSKKIVENMGGKLNAYNVDSGACFEISFIIKD